MELVTGDEREHVRLLHMPTTIRMHRPRYELNVGNSAAVVSSVFYDRFYYGGKTLSS